MSSSAEYDSDIASNAPINTFAPTQSASPDKDSTTQQQSPQSATSRTSSSGSTSNELKSSDRAVPRVPHPITTTIPPPETLLSVVQKRYRSISASNSNQPSGTEFQSVIANSPIAGRSSSSASSLGPTSHIASSSPLAHRRRVSHKEIQSGISSRSCSIEKRSGDASPQPESPTLLSPKTISRNVILRRSHEAIRTTSPFIDHEHSTNSIATGSDGSDGINPVVASPGNLLDHSSPLVRQRSHLSNEVSPPLGKSAFESDDSLDNDDVLANVVTRISEHRTFHLRFGAHGLINPGNYLARASSTTSTDDDYPDSHDEFDTDDGTSDGNLNSSGGSEIHYDDSEMPSSPGVHILPPIIESQSSTGDLLRTERPKPLRLSRLQNKSGNDQDEDTGSDEDHQDASNDKSEDDAQNTKASATGPSTGQDANIDPDPASSKKQDDPKDAATTQSDVNATASGQSEPHPPNQQKAWEDQFEHDEELDRLFMKRQNQYEQQRYVVVRHPNDLHHFGSSYPRHGSSELSDGSPSNSASEDLDHKVTSHTTLFASLDRKIGRKPQSNRNRSQSLDSTRVLSGPNVNTHAHHDNNSNLGQSAHTRSKTNIIHKFFHHMNGSSEDHGNGTSEDHSDSIYRRGSNSNENSGGYIAHGTEESGSHGSSGTNINKNHTHAQHNQHAPLLHQNSHPHMVESATQSQHLVHDLSTIGEDEQKGDLKKLHGATGSLSRDHGSGTPTRHARHYESLFSKLFHHAHVHSRKATEEDGTASWRENDLNASRGGSRPSSKPTSPELRPTDEVLDHISMESLDHPDMSKNNSNEHMFSSNHNSGNTNNSGGVGPRHDGEAANNEAASPNSLGSPIRSPKSAVSREHSVSELPQSPREERHMSASHLAPFAFLKPRSSHTTERKVRERSDTEGSHSLFKDLKTSMHHKRGPSNSVANRVSDDQDTSSPKVTMSRAGSDAVLNDKYGKPDEVLGKGANAIVRLVTSKREEGKNGDSSKPRKDPKCFAIKEFRKRRKDETEKEYVKKVIAEFCISSSIHHENIVETVDLIRDDHGRWCVVMEYCAGGDLFQKAANVGFSGDEEIFCLFRQLLNGVCYIHSVGVTHRDLKPENILLDRSGRILKITDFGTSAVFRTQWETQGHKMHGVCGSEPYIAPEEWDEQHEYIPTKVDVWACGMILYAMMSKSLLWTVAKPTDNHYATYLKKRETGFPQFERYAEGPRQVLYRALEPDPSRRPETAVLLEDKWIKSVEYCKSMANSTDLNSVQHIHKRK